MMRINILDQGNGTSTVFLSKIQGRFQDQEDLEGRVLSRQRCWVQKDDLE